MVKRPFVGRCAPARSDRGRSSRRRSKRCGIGRCRTECQRFCQTVEPNLWQRRGRRTSNGRMSSQGAGPVSSTEESNVAWHTLSVDATLAQQGVDPAKGLSDADVAERRQRYGNNRLAAAKTESMWRRFVRQYRDPMQIVLLVAGAVCLVLPGQLATGILLIALTLFNAALGLNQE